MKEYILCSAIWWKNNIIYEHQPKNVDSGIVICGRRHHNCFVTLMQFHPQRELGETIIQGFLTNTDKFVTREEGAKIAYLSGQIKQEQLTMFSEDLY